MKDWFGPRQKQSLFVLVFMLCGITYYTCRNAQPNTPEAAIKKAVHDLIAAAEDRDLGPFKTYLSEHAHDENGRDRDELLNMLRGIFFAHKKISLSLISLDITPNTNPDIMQAQIVVLMSEMVLPTDRGEFFVTFRRERAGWRIREVTWGEGYGID